MLLRLVFPPALSVHPKVLSARAKNAWKKQKIENIATLLKGALLAEGNVGLKMNVSKKNVDAVVALLSALKKPTVSNLYGGDSVAVETIMDEKKVRDIIPKLKKAGAEGIVEYPLNKVIH